jgi:hypothetical protein
MWEPQPLTTIRASKACRGENFTFFITSPVSSVSFSTIEKPNIIICSFMIVHSSLLLQRMESQIRSEVYTGATMPSDM